MNNLGPGIYGAKVQSWNESNPRSLLKQIMEANKGLNKEELFALFKEELNNHLDHDAFVKTMVEYWFSNTYSSLIGGNQRLVKRLEENKKHEQDQEIMVVEAKEKLKAYIKREAIFLLDTLLPNGKPLRLTTFGECAKFGGLLKRVARKGRPNQKVGSVLTDDDLRRMQG